MNIQKIPVRGKTSPYGFFTKMCYEQHKKKYPDDIVEMAEFLKRCSEKWKTMNDAEKARFFELAKKDAERYQAEIEAYFCKDVPMKKRRQTKDPDAPKKGLDKRPIIKREHPEYSVGQISQELAKLWKALPDYERVIYEQRAAEDKLRYEEEMKIYQQSKMPPPAIVIQEDMYRPLNVSKTSEGVGSEMKIYQQSEMPPPAIVMQEDMYRHLNVPENWEGVGNEMEIYQQSEMPPPAIVIQEDMYQF